MKRPGLRIGKVIHPERLKGTRLKDFKSQTEIIARAGRGLKPIKSRRERCLVCGSLDAKDALIVYGVRFIQCQKCSHIYQKYATSKKRVYDFFQEDKEINCHLHQFDYRARYVSKPKVDQVMKLTKKKKGRWLDIGCGSGELLYYLEKRYKWDGVGFDINGPGVKLAQRHGLTVYKSDLFGYHKDHKQRFDVVSATGYFDLVSYPVRHLRVISKLLEPRGLLMVSHPRFDSVSGELIKLFPENAIRLCSSLDKSVFTDKSMRKFLRDNGFKIIYEWRFGLDFYTFMGMITMRIPKLAQSRINQFFVRHYNEFQEIFDRHSYNDNLFFIAQKTG